MPQACSVCSHPKRDEIDRALVRGEGCGTIAARSGTSKSAVFRHKDHIPKGLVAAPEAAEVARAGTLLEQVKELHSSAVRILATAEKAGALRDALGGIREARGCLELLGKLTGELAAQGAVTVNVGVQTLVQTAIASGLTEERLRALIEDARTFDALTVGEQINELRAALAAKEQESGR